MPAVAIAQPEDAKRSWDELVQRVSEGDAAAWTVFATRLGPIVGSIVRRRSPRLDADGHGDVYVRVLERLNRDGHAALHRYLETRPRYPDLNFVSYLASIACGLLIDHLRSQPEALRRRQQTARKLVAIQLKSLDQLTEPRSADGEAAHRLERTIEAKRVLEKLNDIRFPADQRRALLLWLHGNTAAEIASELALGDDAAADRLVRAARARLRRSSGRDQ